MNTEIAKIPTLQELVETSEQELKENALMVILNQEPPQAWIQQHPFAKIKIGGKDMPLPYLPAERIEYLLSRIYGRWWVEVRNVQLIANSVQVTVRLYVRNPLTREIEWNDGVGAVAIQTDKDAGASDWSKIKNNGVQLAAPSAETYAFKDAAEKFGKLFGKDLSRKQQISYTDLLKPNEQINAEDLRELYDLKREFLSPDEITDAERILNGKEEKSYRKLHKKLMSK